MAKQEKDRPTLPAPAVQPAPGAGSGDDSEMAAGGEIRRLAAAMVAGQLSERGKAEQFSGPAREVIEAVNHMLDALIRPMRVTARSIEQIAHGETPDFVVDEYLGEFNIIKKNLNTFLAILYGLNQETQSLIRAVKEGKLETRGNDWDFEGSWKRLIGGVNETLDATIHPVREASEVLGRLSNYDLTTRMQGKYKGDHARIKKALNTSLEALHLAFSQVAGAVERVSQSGDQILISTEEVAKGASNQATLIGETSSMLSQIAEHTKRTAAATEEANRFARRGQASVEKGKAETERMQATMGRILKSAEGMKAILQEMNGIAGKTDDLAKDATGEASRLAAEARGFGVVVDSIRNAAAQSEQIAAKIDAVIEQGAGAPSPTNASGRSTASQLAEISKDVKEVSRTMHFLSMNAAVQVALIEAVGTGFEDVTDAVRGLANQSKTSASKTGELLSQAVALASEGEKGAETVHRSLMEIVDAVGSLSQLVGGIASASTEQAQKMEGVTQRVTRIREVTEENAEYARQSSLAVGQLAHEKAILDGSIKKFILTRSGEAGGEPALPGLDARTAH